MFQLALTSTTDGFNLKSTFRTLLKKVHPGKNENNINATLVQQDLLDVFQYLKQEEETKDIERDITWERNRAFQEQREEEKKRRREEEKRE